jgi:hypothetical protein
VKAREEMRFNGTHDAPAGLWDHGLAEGVGS